jgi:hypothetical protein
MGVVLFLRSGRRIEQQQKNSLTWPPFDILHSTTNQKHADATEKRCDRTRNRAVTLGERDSIVLGAIEPGGEKN